MRTLDLFVVPQANDSRPFAKHVVSPVEVDGLDKGLNRFLCSPAVMTLAIFQTMIMPLIGRRILCSRETQRPKVIGSEKEKGLSRERGG